MLLENTIYKIEGQDYFINNQLSNCKVILNTINKFGKDYHSVTYINRDGSINSKLTNCPLHNNKLIF